MLKRNFHQLWDAASNRGLGNEIHVAGRTNKKRQLSPKDK